MVKTELQIKGFEMASIGCNHKEISVALNISKVYAHWIVVQYEKAIGIRA